MCKYCGFRGSVEKVSGVGGTDMSTSGLDSSPGEHHAARCPRAKGQVTPKKPEGLDYMVWT